MPIVKAYRGSDSASQHPAMLLGLLVYGKALQRFKMRVRELTSRTRGVSLATMVEELSAYLRGWHGYFGFCQTPTVLRGLDK
jgi:Group II intron, maturase-specific domain